jgi:hypothetical protein
MICESKIHSQVHKSLPCGVVKIMSGLQYHPPHQLLVTVIIASSWSKQGRNEPETRTHHSSLDVDTRQGLVVVVAMLIAFRSKLSASAASDSTAGWHRFSFNRLHPTSSRPLSTTMLRLVVFSRKRSLSPRWLVEVLRSYNFRTPAQASDALSPASLTSSKR